MATAKFELDTKDMVKLLTKMRGNMPRLTARVVNKSAKSAKTAMIKAVRTDMGLKAKVVRDGLHLDLARPGSDPTAKITVSKKRISLIKFGGTQLKRAGWRSKMKGGAGTYKGAFKATMKSGHVGVFRVSDKAKGAKGRDSRGRVKRGRLPIVELHGPSMGKVFAKKWRPVGVKKYKAEVRKNITRELERAARRK